MLSRAGRASPPRDARLDAQPSEKLRAQATAYYQRALKDDAMTQQRKRLIEYAGTKIHEHGLANLMEEDPIFKGLTGLDMLWEGNGYEGVGYGGQFAVLQMLGKDGRRVGASGGAASAILASAGLDNFLALYQAYQLFYAESSTGLSELFRASYFSSAIYELAISEEGWWQDAQEKAVIMCACGARSEKMGVASV